MPVYLDLLFVGTKLIVSIRLIFIAAYICLTSIVLADLLGLELLTSSFGLLVVARGISALAGSPFAGILRMVIFHIIDSYF